VSEVVVGTPEQMRALGVRLAGLLRAGDLVLLVGDLGAGKTTLAAGIGAGLGVRGRVTSPTFVLAREHPSTGGGPALVHVDAYRLGGLAELDDLDLESSVDDAVTLVEWGRGLAEDLATSRLEVVIERPRGAAADGTQAPDAEDAAPRHVTLRGIGPRWTNVDVAVEVGTHAPGPAGLGTAGLGTAGLGTAGQP
jgi:tRNA threonylcarbamoyladenosine biosynthesis protein TsaE